MWKGWTKWQLYHLAFPDLNNTNQGKWRDGEGVLGFSASGLLGFSALGFLASRLLGFWASWLLGFLASWLLGFLASCLFGFLASRLLGFWAFRLFAGLCSFWWLFGFSHPLHSQFLFGRWRFLAFAAFRWFMRSWRLLAALAFRILRAFWLLVFGYLGGTPPRPTRYCLDCLQSNCTPI